MISVIFYYIGILTVFVTHMYILWNGGMEKSESIPHSWINLVAGLLIAGWFITLPKEYMRLKF